MYKDKKALAETLRHYKRHILGPLFIEAADTIEELLEENKKLLDAHDSCPIEKHQDAVPAHWIRRTVVNDPLDPAGLFRNRFECSACGEWQTHGETKYCPNCGKPMQEPPEAHDCHNTKHKAREDIRECQNCLDAGEFPLWEDENG